MIATGGSLKEVIMPKNFPDLKSLEQAARIHKFRNINKNEMEAEYRNALADDVAP